MNNRKHLQGFAKFATGLVLADLLSVIWLGATGYFPLAILGITFPTTSILPIAIFDIAMLIVLVHFGWHINLPIQSPKEKKSPGINWRGFRCRVTCTLAQNRVWVGSYYRLILCARLAFLARGHHHRLPLVLEFPFCSAHIETAY